MSQPSAPNPYLKTQVMTASPEELRLMLYDGCLKFCRQGLAGMEASDFEAIYTNLSRAQKIVLELSTSLNHDVMPDLCGRLSALYTYIYRLLVDANVERSEQKLSEAVKLLEYERETWVMLMEKNNNTRRGGAPEGSAPAAPPAGNPYAAQAQQTAISSLSRSA